MKSKGLKYILGLCIFLSIGIYLYWQNNKSFTVKFINHNDISWSSLSKKVTVIHYWATWCSPCMEEIPKWNEFYNKYKNQINILGFNADGLSVKAQKDLLNEYNIKFLSLQDDILGNLHINPVDAIPATIIIDNKNNYKKIIYGKSALQYIKKYLAN